MKPCTDGGVCFGAVWALSAGDFFARFGGSPWHSDSSEAVLLDLYTSSSVKSSNKVSRGRSSQRMKSFDDILWQNCFFCHILNLTTKQIRETVFKRPVHKSCGGTGGKKSLISPTAVDEDILSEASALAFASDLNSLHEKEIDLN